MSIHFWRFFWRRLVDFPGLLSGNWLGTILPPLALYALLEGRQLRRGWSAMTPEAKKDFWRNSGILVTVYLLLFAWVIVRGIYQDHPSLVCAGQETKHWLRSSYRYQQTNCWRSAPHRRALRCSRFCCCQHHKSWRAERRRRMGIRDLGDKWTPSVSFACPDSS